MNFRKGDTVSVRGTVKYSYDEGDNDKRVFVDVIGSHETLWIKPEDLTLVSQVFEVGDSVRWPINVEGAAPFLYGTVLAIANDHAWIEFGSCEYCTRLLTSIERVEVSDDVA